MNRTPPVPALSHRAFLLFCTSASVLAYEILLMRLLSLALWYHYAAMVISVALLGFGAAGSFLFLFLERIKRRQAVCLLVLSGATAVFYSLAFSLSQKVGSDPLNLVWQGREWFNMFFTYLLLFLPFLTAGGIVGIVMSTAGEKTHFMYAADLLGAGCGAVGIIPALYLAPPWCLLPGLGALVLVGAVPVCTAVARRVMGFGTILVSAGLMAFAYGYLPPVPRMHHTKSLPVTVSFPDARIEAERTGPLGMIHVVGSSLIRHVPGLSLNFGLGPAEAEQTLPEQKGLFVDGEGPSAVARFTGDPSLLGYLDFTTTALPYHTRRPQKALIVGGGGGSDVLLGLRHRTPEMVVLEVNSQIVDLMQGLLAAFSGEIYRRPGIRVELKEARQFLAATEERFDLIQLSLLDSFASSAGGLHSAAEEYLYTEEAFTLYLRCLSDSGILAVTRWLKLPPRDSFRILSTALAALRRSGVTTNPERNLLFIRSWKTSTILVSKNAFRPEEIERATRFCDRRSFDLAYYAGMKEDRANRYDVQKSPIYFLGARALSSPDAGAFLRNYIFDISPTTDDRPYFSHFLRWDKAPELLRQLRREWLPMVELGFVFIIAALIQSILASGVLILLPLAGLRRKNRRKPEGEARPRSTDALCTLVYFGSLGTGFMFLEMALLPKYTLLLAHPIYAAAAVLSAVLVFAGLGSLSVGRLPGDPGRFVWLAVLVILLWVGFHILVGDRLVEVSLRFSLGARLGLTVILISALAFFLGWPFPVGLRTLSGRFPGLVPWAWGINGCASVVGAVLG
ncbi:MAG: SAM-dependent methyltransferase, partial [Deltaproteobacteria bacterium]|nr:SAM-dependent methyltransferase [Deltaproteobacteria bacterium]